MSCPLKFEEPLKIDRSFVSALTDGAKPTALVRSIVDLAAALDVDTIAEGVELKEQVEILKGLGCRIAQGFYFGEPRPARELDSMLQHGATIPERMLGTRFRRTGMTGSRSIAGALLRPTSRVHLA